LELLQMHMLLDQLFEEKYLVCVILLKERFHGIHLLGDLIRIR